VKKKKVHVFLKKEHGKNQPNILTGKARKIIELNVDKYRYICTTDYKTLEEIEREID
jgi:hypothetical protein